MRDCIKPPNAAVLKVPQLLAAAAEAHLAGDGDGARKHFRKADNLEVFFWLNPAWYHIQLNVVDPRPVGDSCVVPRDRRDPDRTISRVVKTAVLERDGHRCRYCRLPVIDAAIRKIAHRLYPEAVP